MRKNKAMRERLEAERNRLKQQIEVLQRQSEALQNQLVGVERSIGLISGETTAEIYPARGRTRNVKDTVLGLLAEAAGQGLTVIQLLEIAQNKGKHLDRGSVSSLLSRLKRENILDMVDGVYRIKNASADVVSLHAQTH